MENNYDINSNLDFILNNNIENTVKGDIILQEKILKSEDFNTTFKYIEDSLNLMYEKSRVLQDIIVYTRAFLNSEITNSIADCKTLLQSIEQDKDLIKNKTYINYSIPFYFGLNNVLDRNNTILSDAIINNDRMINSYSVINNNKTNFFNVTRKQNSLHNNADEYLTTNQYRTLYMFNKIQSAALEETLIFSFNSAIKINKIVAALSNCNIKEVKLLLDTENYINLDINKLDSFDEKIVKSIEITISTTNYSISQTAYSNITNNNFSAIINNINTDENSIIGVNKYYYYLFGVDEIKFQYVKEDNTSGFCSQNIAIGALTSNEYLTLYTEDSIEEGSIEYYIINGAETIPILPENVSKVIDEKIFYKYPTRFTIDSNYEVVIKKNGQVVNTSLYEAINTNDGNLWTVSYTPIINNFNNLYNESIKVKVIIRSYNTIQNSFIKNIKIRKYGGNNLWTV